MRSLCSLALAGGLILTGCASNDLKYYISMGTAPVSEARSCTLQLQPLVKAVLKSSGVEAAPSPESTWTVRGLQIALERRMEDAVRNLKCAHDSEKNISLNERAVKWLGVYALESGDPDQDLRRFEEYLRSRELTKVLVKNVSLTADEDPKEVERLLDPEEQYDVRSQWCGDPGQPGEVCPHRLYKTYPDGGDLDKTLWSRIREVRAKGDRDTRFLVLGYEIPWDEDYTLIRYGVSFYFIDTLAKEDSLSGKTATKTEFIGYALDYANEAMPTPALAQTGKERCTVGQPCERTEVSLSKGRRVLYATGYPFALAIGLKNAAFEVAKMPFSTIAGLLFGRDLPSLYPIENIRSAVNAIKVETLHLPSYSFVPGLLNFVAELPFVGQAFHLNTGPEHLDWDQPPDKTTVRRKIFLTRGIYGGDKWGQDTGLWSAWARVAYPDYDVYSPAYRHGTVTDVIWSMFNLSHGPGYSEAAYVMRHAGKFDRLYLSGHSGGVQRSASASRILANHGYGVQKVLGIAGPSVGQAYVDDRFPNAFRIFLNADVGANQDVTSKIGLVAGTYASVTDALLIGPPKYVFGGLVGLFSDNAQVAVYEFFDRMGSTNATITQVKGKVSTLHQTPFRQSFAEPIVFDAYVRSEFATAFRDDLERPSDESEFWKERLNEAFGRDFWDLPGDTEHDAQRYDKERKGTIPWQRLGH
jgi:hypothetical protein